MTNTWKSEDLKGVQLFMEKNYSTSGPGKWMLGELHQKTGPVSYEVKLLLGGIFNSKHQLPQLLNKC